MNSVRVILAGGLGNQLFMYAAGRALAGRIGGQLILDTSAFSRDRVFKRIYLLDQFPIHASIDRSELRSSLILLADPLLRRMPAIPSVAGLIYERTRLGLPVFQANLVEDPPRGSLTLRGYWQSERYFLDHVSQVRRELTPPKPTSQEALDELALINSTPHAVAVGIRFYHEVPGANTDAPSIIAEFRARLVEHSARSPESTYYVFTEEPQHFKDRKCLGVPFTLISHRARNEEAPVNLYLMTKCRTFFISYSSYHWWGAWLCEDARRKVHYIRFKDRQANDYPAVSWTILDAGFSKLTS